MECGPTRVALMVTFKKVNPSEGILFTLDLSKDADMMKLAEDVRLQGQKVSVEGKGEYRSVEDDVPLPDGAVLRKHTHAKLFIVRSKITVVGNK
jgi:hypothetical protein